jgi:hypothetical protein
VPIAGIQRTTLATQEKQTKVVNQQRRQLKQKAQQTSWIASRLLSSEGTKQIKIRRRSFQTRA